jgi:hypothetical protein
MKNQELEEEFEVIEEVKEDFEEVDEKKELPRNISPPGGINIFENMAQVENEMQRFNVFPIVDGHFDKKEIVTLADFQQALSVNDYRYLAERLGVYPDKLEKEVLSAIREKADTTTKYRGQPLLALSTMLVTEAVQSVYNKYIN